MTTLVHTQCSIPAKGPRTPAVLSWVAVHRQRRALGRLDDAALCDIGLSRAEAEAEMRRPFWDIV